MLTIGPETQRYIKTRNAWMYHPGLDKLVKIIVSFFYNTLLVLHLIAILS